MEFQIHNQIKKTFLDLLNPFVSNAPFLYPLKTAEDYKVFCGFQGV